MRGRNTPPKAGSESKKRVKYTLDSIISPEFRFYQPARGYRVNIDTLILYGFASHHARGRVLEIGPASGVVSLLLSRQSGISDVTGVEIEDDLYHASLKNLHLHGAGNRVRFLHDDINRYKTLFRGQTFDSIVTNPPFCREGTGKIGAGSTTRSARHDSSLTLDGLFRAARYLLKPKGYLIMLFMTRRIDEVFACIRGFHAEVLRFVHRKQDRPSDIFLLLARKGGGKPLSIVPPLIVHEADGYSPELSSLLHAPARPEI